MVLKTSLNGNNMRNLKKRKEVKKDRSSLLESPIEEKVYNALKRYGVYLIPQHKIGKYRVDFALPNRRIAIECDGKEWHKDKTKDTLRDTYLFEKGWIVYRFEGWRIEYKLRDVINEILSLVDDKKTLHDRRKNIEINDDMPLDVQEELRKQRQEEQEDFEETIEERLRKQKWISGKQLFTKKHIR